MTEDFECSVCGSTTLVCRGVGRSDGSGFEWVLECGNGHWLLPFIGYELTITRRSCDHDLPTNGGKVGNEGGGSHR